MIGSRTAGSVTERRIVTGGRGSSQAAQRVTKREGSRARLTLLHSRPSHRLTGVDSGPDHADAGGIAPVHRLRFAHEVEPRPFPRRVPIGRLRNLRDVAV